MALSISKSEARKTVRAVEAALRDGFPPPGQTGKPGQRGAVAEAARRLTISPKTIRSRVDPGGACESHELAVDWSLWRRPKPVDPPPDRIAERAGADQIAELRARVVHAERRAAEALDYRANILGLTSERLKPTLFAKGPSGQGQGGRTLIAHFSDAHRGETVELDQMDGVNAYNRDISRARAGRFFDTVASLATEHWHGPSPDEIVLCLGGDMISGNIHFELTETNDLASPAAVKEIAEDIAGGLKLWRRRVKVPVRVISVPGNHARLTLKSQSKRRAAHNLDLLVADFVEASMLDDSGVSFFGTVSPDAYFSTYGWNWCLTHGDAMGVGGGKGYIGPIAPIVKGHRLLVDNAAKTRRRVDFVLTAHYHTTARTSFGWANGALIGYNEYARDLRCDPEPPKQNLLTVHARRGVIDHQEIHVGAPGEGRLCEGAPD